MPAERQSVEPAEEALPSELEAPSGTSAPGHRAVHFELQELSGRPADADEHGEHNEGDVHGGRGGVRPAQPASESRWYSGVDLDDPIGFIKGLDRTLGGMAPGRGDSGELGDSPKWQGAVRRLNPVRKRPAEQLASALIFAAFVAVASLVGIICVSSLDAAYQDERNTDDLLHDAQAFVPAKLGGTLPVDAFEDGQQPNKQMGNELNRLYKESAHHSWAGHDFDVAFVTGGGGQVPRQRAEADSTSGRMQTLAEVPKPVHATEAHLPRQHVHGKRVWGWLHKSSEADKAKQSSHDISESLSKQADYIIGYPDLEDNSPARTEGLVQTPHGSRIRKGMLNWHMKPMPLMHKVQSLGPLPALGGNQHSESVMNAQKAVKVVKKFIQRAPGDVPTFKTQGQGAMHSLITGSRFTKARDEVVDATPVDAVNQVATHEEQQSVVSPAATAVVIRRTLPVEPVVIAIPHQAGAPVPVKAIVSVVNSPAALPPLSVHVPSRWVKGATRPVLPLKTDSRTREEKFLDHAAHTSQAQSAAEAARQIVANGQVGKACFQEGHGTEPCPTIDYHPKVHEDWKGAPDRPGNPPTPPAQVESEEPESEEPTGIDWPAPGKDKVEAAEPVPVSEGPLKIEHEHFGPDISEEDDDDSLPSTGPSHESFEGVPSAPPPPPAVVEAPTPAAAESAPTPVAEESPLSAEESPLSANRARGDLTWSAPSNGTSPATESTGYLTKTVNRLEDVVGELSGMVEKMMGVAPSQNVYVTNNYNNVTVQNANVTSAGSWASAQAPGRLPTTVVPTILPYPDMFPYGGVYADQVVVHLENEVNGTSVYYSVNASGTQGDPTEYTEPFVLGPGWTKVEAVAIKSGYNASAIREAVFQVMNCNGDKCCNWRVVYLRFEAVLARLVARKEEIPKEQVSKQAAKDADEVDWLNAQSKYQDARISEKSAASGAKYARSFQRKWGFAFSDSQSDLNGMEKKVTRKLRELLDERELIMDILSKLDNDELSASRAMGMVQQSLAACSACKAWRSIAASPDGEGAATTFALASTLGGHQEVKDVKAILQEILDDLNARRALYEKMLSGARLQVFDNEKKLNKWTNEAAQMSAQVFEDEKKISQYSKRGQELSGKVEVDKQAWKRGKEFMQDDMDILERHISAIRRILKRIRVALGECPGGSPEERYPAPAAVAAPATEATDRVNSYASTMDDSNTKGDSREKSASERFLASAEPVAAPSTVATKAGMAYASQSDYSHTEGSSKESESDRFLKDETASERTGNRQVSSARVDSSDFKM